MRPNQAAWSLKENNPTIWSNRKADSMRLGCEHKTQLFNVSQQTCHENYQNEITQRIWLWMYQEQFVILSVNQELAINLTWPALKNKQCFEIFEVFLTSSADQCFLRVFLILIWNHFPTKHPTSRLYLIIGPPPLPGKGGEVQLLNHFVT